MPSLNIKPTVPLNYNEEPDSFVLELQRLLLCYQAANSNDRNVVWAVLNKYASQIDKL